jgi:AraC family transcriptional regulator of arabinose operon
MEYISKRYIIPCMPDCGTSVLLCGYIESTPGRKDERYIHRTYSVHFIVDGKGKLSMGNRDYELEKGQGFVLFPNTPIECESDSDQPWTYYYIDFEGPDSLELLKKMGVSLKSASFDFELNNEILNTLELSLSAAKENISSGYDVIGYFLIAMSNPIHLFNKNGQKSTSNDQYFQQACSYISRHLNKNISVNDIASAINIDRTHLYRLFKKQLNLTPSEYLLKSRIGRAISLMTNEELSIAEIARSVGFHNASHFSRVFLENKGTTPKEYRKISKEKRIKTGNYDNKKVLP